MIKHVRERFPNVSTGNVHEIQVDSTTKLEIALNRVQGLTNKHFDNKYFKNSLWQHEHANASEYFLLSRSSRGSVEMLYCIPNSIIVQSRPETKAGLSKYFRPQSGHHFQVGLIEKLFSFDWNYFRFFIGAEDTFAKSERNRSGSGISKILQVIFHDQNKSIAIFHFSFTVDDEEIRRLNEKRKTFHLFLPGE